MPIDMFATKDPMVSQMLPWELRTQLLARINAPRRETLGTKLRELLAIRRRCREIRRKSP